MRGSAVGPAVALATATALVVLGAGIAMAAVASNLYLVEDSEPVGSMSTSAPSAVSLPNFDPDRDPEPGLLLAKSASGVAETDPTKYQQWEYDVSGTTVSVSQFVIWATPKDFDSSKTGLVNAYLLDCGGTCTLLDSTSKSVPGSGKWMKVTMYLSVTDRSFEAGRRLVVRITVDDTSDDDMWFAYATASYQSHLTVTGTSPTTTTAPTTTTTTAPTTTSSTTTTMAAGTTTAIPGTTTTTAGAVGREISTTTIVSPASSQPKPDVPSHQVTLSAGDLVAVASLNPMGALALSEKTGHLSPEEGLMVAFAVVTETITLYWQVALALGLLASALLWMGLSRRERDDKGPPRELED